MFIHTHVGKCGGKTLTSYLETLLGNQHVCDVRLAGAVIKDIDWRSRNYNYLTNVRLLVGHFWYDTPLAKIFPNTKWASRFLPLEALPCFRKKPLYIASVRHPVERLESFFRYLRTRPGHNAYNEGIKNNNFDQFIDILILKNNSKIKNGICSQLTRCHNSPNLFEQAKNALDHHYLAIVPYNKTHELANILAEVLLLPKVENRIVNPSTPGKKIIPRKETLMVLEENCQYDIQLYDYILKEYQAKLENAKLHLQLLLK